jgi:hypothetical protein
MFGAQMPEAMRGYFGDISSQMQSAMAKYHQQRQLQFDMFAKREGMERDALEKYKAFITTRPSFTADIEKQGRERLGQEFEKIEKKNLASSMRRGLGSTDVDLTKSTAGKTALASQFEAQMSKLKSMEKAQRSDEMAKLTMMEGMLPVQQIGKRAALEREYAPYVFDPTSYMGFNLSRIGMQPWGQMTSPVQYNQPGMLGGALGSMAGQFGGAALGALI